jgi:hypothetical protein
VVGPRLLGEMYPFVNSQHKREIAMKRKFKDFIPKDQTRAHPALGGLSEKFGQNVDWRGPKDPPPKSDEMELMMLRLPNEEPNPARGCKLVAGDRRAYKGNPDEASAELGRLWESMLNRVRPSPPDWSKAGAVIWDHLDFKVDPEWTAGMLGLDHADDDTTRACQAALFGVFATFSEGVDLEPLLFALSTFINTHPRLAEYANGNDWHLPYGENTQYRVSRSRSKATRTKPKLGHRP